MLFPQGVEVWAQIADDGIPSIVRGRNITQVRRAVANVPGVYILTPSLALSAWWAFGIPVNADSDGITILGTKASLTPLSSNEIEVARLNIVGQTFEFGPFNFFGIY
jgi:hypothetical protein